MAEKTGAFEIMVATSHDITNRCRGWDRDAVGPSGTADCATPEDNRFNCLGEAKGNPIYLVHLGLGTLVLR